MRIELFFLCFFLQVNISLAQMVDGRNIPEFGETFGVEAKKTDYVVKAYLIKSSIPGNVLWPSDQVELTIQVSNSLAKEIHIDGKIEIISYGTRGRTGDIWTPQMFKISDVTSMPVNVHIQPNAFQDIVIKPQLPEAFGAYGFVVDLGVYGKQFIGSSVRTFAFQPERVQYPSFCLDDNSIDVLQRLGVHAIRHGIDYKHSDDPDFEAWYEAERQRLKAYDKADIAVLIKMGAPTNYSKIHPLGMPRPWLNGKDEMQNTKCDMSWLPQYDEDFKKLVYKLAVEFGWPKGPVNAFALWNEPWEGISISGWGADMLRYREIYTKMAEAVEEARRDAKVDVLVGGLSSTSNALDKLFADGTDEFLDRFDFCSIHYQGMASSATIKKWANRKSERGRVKIWDTESWVANVDDRVAAVVATNRSAGYDRAMGIYLGNICHIVPQKYFDENGKTKETEIIHAWSVAASIGATQHFIGDRPFKELLFKNGLPWISVFEGKNNNPDDGTLVVVGDIGEEFGSSNVLFRTARGLKEQSNEEELRKQLATIDKKKNPADYQQIQEEIEKNEILEGATLSVADQQGRFLLYDFYGNKVPAIQGVITVPLDGRGFFLRSDGSAGSFDLLINAVRKSRVEGIEPLETVVSDFLSPINSKPELKLKLTNVLNRPVKGTLAVSIGALKIEHPSSLSFAAHETKIVSVKVLAGKSSVDNSYPLDFVFNAGVDGKAMHREDVHVNVIAKRKINVDGNLEDWKDALPFIIKNENSSSVSLTEAAWFPFKNFDQSVKGGLSSGYLAYDDDYFYFAAKVSDESPDLGMNRFETRNDDDLFYPQKSYVPANSFRFGGAMKHEGVSFSARWEGMLKADYSEDYTLTISSKNPARLWLNGELVIDAWLNQHKNSAIVSLNKGKVYSIKLEYSKEWNNSPLELQWKSKHHSFTTIPTAYLFTDSPLKQKKGDGLNASYFSGPEFNALQVKRVDRLIKFDWKGNEFPDSAFYKNPLIELEWPKGVRRYSYRKDTDVPSGNFQDHDNIQIAFNVLDDEDKDLYAFPKGTMKGYTNYQCTDYEYALNPVAEQYGGGVEIWRLKYPGMPHKHFFPRQPASPMDGPVKNGKLSIVRSGNTRITEVAIPWSEIPHVKQKLDKGDPIKFSFRVNDNTPQGCMELARGRSVSKINHNAFSVDWKDHWANEVEFVFER